MEKGFIISLIFAFLIVIFAIANSETVIVDFIFTKITMSQAVVIMGSALLGALIVFLISLIKKIRLTQEIKSLKGKISKLEEENKLIKDLKKCDDKNNLEELE